MKDNKNSLEVKLNKLNRNELLQLLLEQTRENEKLRQENEALTNRLNEKMLKVSIAGNLANAVLAVNGIMESAQKAADQYLENIAEMEKQTKIKCELMIKQAEDEAESIRSRKKPKHKKRSR